MAVSAQDRKAIILALLNAYGDNYTPVAQMMRYLIAALPAIAWETELRTQAAAFAPFIASGLSITWWCDEVMRLSAL